MKLGSFLATLSLSGLLISPAVAGDDNDGLAAQARFHDNQGEAVGEARIHQGPHGLLITLEVDGLKEGKKAIHIHSKGTCDDQEEGFVASGGHLNPEDKKHGLMNEEGPDAGDLNNFYVHENGYGWAELFTPRASLDGSFGAKILDEDGAALVIHENPDNHRDQPIGGAGARVACAVIEPH